MDEPKMSGPIYIAVSKSERLKISAELKSLVHRLNGMYLPISQRRALIDAGWILSQPDDLHDMEWPPNV